MLTMGILWTAAANSRKDYRIPLYNSTNFTQLYKIKKRVNVKNKNKIKR